MWSDKKLDLFITCARGGAPYLEEEVTRAGFAVTARQFAGVEIVAFPTDIMRLNLILRTAQSVLVRVAAFSCCEPEELYRRINGLAWETMIPADGYLSVVSNVDTPAINNSMYVNQKVKDAIVDRIMKQKGSRPDSGPKRDRVVVNVYWKGKDCIVYLNTSGQKLSDRGYRKIPGKAPLREVLAAAIIQATGYDGNETFISPMCGSGTLAIEAALIAQHRAPGLLRSNFGLKHLAGFDPEQWQKIRKTAQKERVKEIAGRIIATDSDARALAAARQNARTAGVDQLIEFHTCDFTKSPVPDGGGVIILNPEYGERLGKVRRLEKLYAEIGDWFKQSCPGYRGYIFSGNFALLKKVGLRSRRRLPFFNGDIECRLCEYELYAGSGI